MTGHTRDSGMANTGNPHSDAGQPVVYQIRHKGHLGRQWAGWLGGVTITLEDKGDALLTSSAVDQAALSECVRRCPACSFPVPFSTMPPWVQRCRHLFGIEGVRSGWFLRSRRSTAPKAHRIAQACEEKLNRDACTIRRLPARWREAAGVAGLAGPVACFRCYNRHTFTRAFSTGCR